MKLTAGAILILAAAVCLAGGLVADAICIGSNRLNSPAAWGYIASLIVGVFGLFLIAVGLAEALDAGPRGSDRQPVKSPGTASSEEGHQA